MRTIIGQALFLSAATFALATAAALPQPAPADTPLSAETLGHLDGIFGFCSRVNPQNASKYKEQMKALLDGASEADVAALRDTEEYRQTYESIGTQLDELPKEQAIGTCNAALESKS